MGHRHLKDWLLSSFHLCVFFRVPPWKQVTPAASLGPQFCLWGKNQRKKYYLEGTNNYYGHAYMPSDIPKSKSKIIVPVSVQWASIPLPLRVWTIQKTFFIPIAGNLVKTKSSALLNLTEPKSKLKTSTNVTESLIKSKDWKNMTHLSSINIQRTWSQLLECRCCSQASWMAEVI